MRPGGDIPAEQALCGTLDLVDTGSTLARTRICALSEGTVMNNGKTPPIEQPEGLAERLIDVRRATEDFVNADIWRPTLRWYPLLFTLAVCLRLDEDGSFPPLAAYKWLVGASWDDLDTLAFVAGLTALNAGLSADDMVTRSVEAGSHVAGMVLGRRTSTEELTQWEAMQMSHTIQSMNIHDRLVLLDLAQAVFRLVEFTPEKILTLRH